MYRSSWWRGIGATLLVVLVGTSALAQPTTRDAPQHAEAPATTPREVIAEAIPPILELLSDKSLSDDERGDRLMDIVRQRMDFAVLLRLMLGPEWDKLPEPKRQEFIAAFEQYLNSVYLPLLNEYSGQRVRVTEDSALARGDHAVMIRISEQRGEIERQLGSVVCRMRKSASGWRAIDLTVEGISIARIMGAQFRPVLEQGGIDGVIARLREKSQS